MKFFNDIRSSKPHNYKIIHGCHNFSSYDYKSQIVERNTKNSSRVHSVDYFQY